MLDNLGYPVVGLLFVAVLVFAILSWKRWHWTNSVFLILSFLVGTFALVALANVYQIRSAMFQDLERSEQAYARNLKDANEAIYGPPSTTYSSESLRGVSFALDLELLGRGRVWSHGAVEATAADQTKVFVIAGQPIQGDAEVKLQDLVLYAFGDVDNGQGLAPTLFIGTVKVDSSSPGRMNLSPVFLVNEQAYAAGGSWTLFERMPGDRHETFVRANNLAADISIDEYRNLLTNTIFPAEQIGMEPNSERYEAFIDQFAFDGRPIGEIQTWIETNQANRFRKTFLPSEDEEFILYKFEKSPAKPYRVDASGGNLDNDGPFTLLGEAIDQTLHLGREVQFKAGDTVLVNRATANGYQRADGTTVPRFDQLESVSVAGGEYHRRLFDFPAQISDYRRETQDYSQQLVDVKEKQRLIREANVNAERQIETRFEMIAKLKADETNLKGDLATIQSMYDSKTQQLSDMQVRIADLEQQLENFRKSLVGGTN